MKKQHSRKPKAEPKAKPRRGGRGAKRSHAKKAGESSAPPSGTLRGWKAIAQFLALPVNVAQRWAKDGMPLRREGRFTVADADELRHWLGRESEMPAPAHIAVNSADLAAGLNESIAAVRRQKRAATRLQ
ncbi:MAG TPA: hypothetical protein VFP59_02660 [Candidatus Angelobacter sp.]|nr:hypothetical protein [Candidatus Angelobacter sp.]